LIFKNIIQIETKNIYTKDIITSTHYEDLIHYKFDSKIFDDIRNSSKLIQILIFKSGVYLYVKMPRFLYISDFNMTYWLDENATIPLPDPTNITESGYYYINIGEDEGSISAVVPNETFLQLL
jgi:hypothetical protein